MSLVGQSIFDLRICFLEAILGTAVKSFVRKLSIPFTPSLVVVFGPSSCPMTVGSRWSSLVYDGGPLNPCEAPPRPLDATNVESMVDDAPRYVLSHWHGSVTWQGVLGDAN